ncbi:MAG: hypothetical protein LZ173_08490 [Thaumarchaeota archaeon]|jgi:hypothetical protein|nr:hypothetical protein [Candidatus Geocrenenecus arthurdayi]
MPLKYGAYKIAWRRLKRCQDEEIWDRILKKLVTTLMTCSLVSCSGNLIERELKDNYPWLVRFNSRKLANLIERIVSPSVF